ncbi:MAG: signal peptidase I [Gaiellaceae bacterium]
MSDDWGSYRSGSGGEGNEEKDDAGTGSEEPGRDDPGGWPQEPETGATGWPTPEPTWQRPDYGGYGSPRRDELFDDDDGEPEPYESQHSRDPLARLFPGLPRSVRVTLDWILTIAGAILIVLALKQWVVNPYRIPSSSMEPTLNCAKGPANPGCLGNSSDRVLACRICLDFGHNPSRGDIVVFNTPSRAATECGEGGTFVKRVIGLPGDTVHEDKRGNIWIKSPGSRTFVELKEPYISAQDRLADSEHFGITRHVPEGQYFMMGDNRSESCDSRTWGSVPRNKLIGIVFFVYWPPDRISLK